MKIQEITQVEAKSQITEQILHSLSDWFELEDGIQNYITGVQDKPFFVVMQEDHPVGFLSLQDHNQYTSEIYVMGVLPQYHRQGIGRQLVEHAQKYMAQHGCKFLFIKTLAEIVDDPFYAKTRQFYEAMGFLPLFITTKIWGPDNPCLIMIQEVCPNSL